MREVVQYEYADERQAEMAAMAKFRREWAAGEWKKRPLVDLIKKSEWFEDMVVRHPNHARDDVRLAEDMRGVIDLMEKRMLDAGMAENPLAFFKPSWTQAQILNAWHPEFEPEKAPQGYRTVLDVSSVRSGKTTANIVDMLMWMVPNDPQWAMFEPYLDFKGRHVQVFRRPNWDYWQRRGMMTYSRDEPPKDACENWHGCPDEQHWKEKLDREYRKWFPPNMVAMRGKDRQWNITERWFETKWGSRVNGKLYMSDMQAWSGKELFCIILDEGPPRDKLDEAKIRCSYIRWAFTPREAANIGDRVKVAHDVYRGKYPMPGPMRTFQFSWDDVPEHIMPEEKKKMRRNVLRADSEADRVTSEGGFFFSSPVVFEAFDRKTHILPVTGEAVIRAIRGEMRQDEKEKTPWLEKFYRANVIRGFDEGTVHPSACAWVAVLRTGERVMFREWSMASHAIAERVRAIVELSGNRLVEAPRYGPEAFTDARREQATGAVVKRMRELQETLSIRRTVADSKMWKVDPNHPLEDHTAHYSRAGLKLERATNALPNVRCDQLNGLMKPDRTRAHLSPAQENPDDPHGSLFYITMDCPKMVERFENYLWQQVASGPRVGDFTGKPELRDDDLVDAACYAFCERITWIDMDEIAKRVNGAAA